MSALIDLQHSFKKLCNIGQRYIDLRELLLLELWKIGQIDCTQEKVSWKRPSLLQVIKKTTKLYEKNVAGEGT